mmetsp:Transcript_2229/g.4082  ORF Transcript_2229/g.4082 Transcript_2229/m.4082 type:complete len:80 (+) Transcript_2229:998-1237(+)
MSQFQTDNLRKAVTVSSRAITSFSAIYFKPVRPAVAGELHLVQRIIVWRVIVKSSTHFECGVGFMLIGNGNNNDSSMES